MHILPDVHISVFSDISEAYQRLDAAQNVGCLNL